jgi:hypothetical protein
MKDMMVDQTEIPGGKKEAAWETAEFSGYQKLHVRHTAQQGLWVWN